MLPFPLPCCRGRDGLQRATGLRSALFVVRLFSLCGLLCCCPLSSSRSSSRSSSCARALLLLRESRRAALLSPLLLLLFFARIVFPPFPVLRNRTRWRRRSRGARRRGCSLEHRVLALVLAVLSGAVTLLFLLFFPLFFFFLLLLLLLVLFLLLFFPLLCVLRRGAISATAFASLAVSISTTISVSTHSEVCDATSRHFFLRVHVVVRGLKARRKHRVGVAELL